MRHVAPPCPSIPDSRPASRSELEARIAAHPVTGSVDEMRAAFARLTGPHPDLGPRIPLGGIGSARIGTGPRMVMWLHGGGYVFGSPESHAFAAAHLADSADATVWLPEYPRAPDAAWPEQACAASAALDALAAKAGGPVALVGDSAGGHLALRVALARPDRVASLSVISPNADRSGRSTTRLATGDLMNDDATDARLARLVFGDDDGDDPQLSPWRDDLSALPPTMILAAATEVLLDDALILARAVARADRLEELRVWPGLFHLWPLWPEALPEARAALDMVAAQIARHLT